MRNVALLVLSVFLVGWASSVVIGNSALPNMAFAVASPGPHLVPVRALTADAYGTENDSIYYEADPGSSADPSYGDSNANDAAPQYESQSSGTENDQPDVPPTLWGSYTPSSGGDSSGETPAEDPSVFPPGSNSSCPDCVVSGDESYGKEPPTDVQSEVGRPPYAESFYVWSPNYLSAPEEAPSPEFVYDPPYYDYYNDYYYDPYPPAPEPWYVKDFGGYGVVAQNLIPGLAPATRAPLLTSAPIISNPAPQPTYPAPSYPVPSCSITASPGSIAYGASTILRWNSAYSQSASLSGFGTVSVAGSRSTGSLTGTRTYTLNISGPGGSAVCSTVVSVAQPAGPASCVISVHPESIRIGEQASLVWGAQNAQSASLSGTGAVSAQGSLTIAPRSPQTYTLTVRSVSGAAATCATQIAVH